MGAQSRHGGTDFAREQELLPVHGEKPFCDDITESIRYLEP